MISAFIYWRNPPLPADVEASNYSAFNSVPQSRANSILGSRSRLDAGRPHRSETKWSDRIEEIMAKGGPNATAKARALVEQWAMEDWEAAATFVSGLPTGREQIIIAYGVVAAPVRPQKAAEWVEPLARLQGSHAVLYHVFNSWYSENAGEATNWLLGEFGEDNPNIRKCVVHAFETWPESRQHHLVDHLGHLLE